MYVEIISGVEAGDTVYVQTGTESVESRLSLQNPLQGTCSGERRSSMTARAARAAECPVASGCPKIWDCRKAWSCPKVQNCRKLRGCPEATGLPEGMELPEGMGLPAEGMGAFGGGSGMQPDSAQGFPSKQAATDNDTEGVSSDVR